MGRQMKKKTDFSDLKRQERDNRRNLIMDAAQRVFAANPFDKVNMRQIAKEVGISPGSLYIYFENQEALFIEVSLQGADKLIKMLRGLDKGDPSCVAKAALAYIDFITENYEYLCMMQHSMLYGKFTSADSLEKLIRTYRELFTEFDAVLKNVAPEAKLRTYSHLFFASLNGILFSYGRFPERGGDEALVHMRELAAMFADLFTKGKPLAP